MNIQLKDKEPQSRANSANGETVTPKVAQLILAGLTAEIVVLGKERMLIHTPDGYPELILRANVLKRVSNYNLTEVLAARDTLILLGPAYTNTTSMYERVNDELYLILSREDFKATGKDVLLLREVIGEHLDSMNVELRIDYGGVALVKTTSNDDGGDALE